MPSRDPIVVDNSTLSAMSRCTTKGLLRYGLGFTTSEEYSTLRCGSAFHSAMEVYLKEGIASYATAIFETQYREWSEANVPVGHRLEYANVARILAHWLDDHPLDAMPYTVESSMVEVGFAFPLCDGVIYTGRFDAAVQDKRSDAWYVLDHKTTGYISEERVNKYQSDSQMSGYLWALEQFTGEPAQGAFINMIELKKLPSDPKRKCRTHGMPYADCGLLHAASQLFIVERTPQQIAQWKKTAIDLAYKYYGYMTAGLKLANIPDMPVEGQFNGSCEWCEFSQICTSGKPMHMLEQLRYDPWVPYDMTLLKGK